jgi:hypothetical protein
MAQEVTATSKDVASSYNAQEIAKASLDLRKSHFLVGTATPLMESNASAAFRANTIDNQGALEKIAIQNKMQKGNFKIGDEKNRGPHQSTYKQLISNQDRPHIEQGTKTDDRNHLKGAVNLGSQIVEYVSENKSK